MNTRSFIRIAALAGAIFYIGFGVWAFVAPRSFYETLATFPPYNHHFMHDAGAFQIGLGLTLLLGILWADTLFAVLVANAAAGFLHVASHLIDHDLGGTVEATVVLGLIAVALTVAAVQRASQVPRAPRRGD